MTARHPLGSDLTNQRSDRQRRTDRARSPQWKEPNPEDSNGKTIYNLVMPKKPLIVRAHDAVIAHLWDGGLAVDATAGNGHDTCFLAERVGPTGRVIALDIQECAVTATRAQVEDAKLSERVSVFKADHANLLDYVPESWIGKTSVVLFNLGYLPGSDKKIVTRPETTVSALTASLSLLAGDGILSVLLYLGHSGGAAEATAVSKWLEELPVEHFAWESIGSEKPNDPLRHKNATPILTLVTRV